MESTEQSSLFSRIVANATAGPSGLVNYNSIQPQAQRGFGAPFAAAALSHPTFRRLRVPAFAGFGLSTTAVSTLPLTEGMLDVTEQTPLFTQASSSRDDLGEDDY